MAEPEQPQWVSADDVKRLVDEQNAERDAKIDALQAELEAARKQGQPVTDNVPEHAAGPGLERAETWSQAEQEAAQLEAGRAE